MLGARHIDNSMSCCELGKSSIYPHPNPLCIPNPALDLTSRETTTWLDGACFRDQKYDLMALASGVQHMAWWLWIQHTNKWLDCYSFIKWLDAFNAWLKCITIRQQGWLARLMSINKVMDLFDLDEDNDTDNELIIEFDDLLIMCHMMMIFWSSWDLFNYNEWEEEVMHLLIWMWETCWCCDVGRLVYKT